MVAPPFCLSNACLPPRRAGAGLSAVLCTALTAGLFAPGIALADVVSVTPLVAKGVNAERVNDLFDLMSFELENVANVDEVIQINPAPPALTSSCLESVRCLGAIARESDADALLTGAVERRGKELTLDIVYYDVASNRVLRRDAYVMPDDPTAILEEMTPIVGKAVTGIDPRRQEAAARMDNEDFGAASDDDDLDFYAPGAGTGLTDAPPPRSTGGGVNTTPRAITPAPLPDGPSTPPPADPGDISFGDAEPDISVDFGDSSVSYGDTQVNQGYVTSEGYTNAAPAPTYGTPTYGTPATTAPPAGSYGTAPTPRYVEPAGDPMADPYEDDINAPVARGTIGTEDDSRRGRSATSSSTTKSKGSPGGGSADDLSRFTITAKGGYTNYAPFNFGTVGAELGIRAVAGLHFVVGADLYIVRRALPPELVEQGRPAVESNFIVPINAGLLYRFNPGRFKPYLGADFIMSQYYLDPTTRANKFAVGGRGRLGSDVMLTDSFGLNLDLAVGGWTGDAWPSVDPRAKAAGLLPHVSVGLVLAL